MKISLNWIKDYVDLGDVCHKDLLNKFTLSVAEIEGYEELGSKLSGVVSAKIQEVMPHPNSKKLTVLTVDAGQHGEFSVVCGAPNVSVGMIVPFALIGASVNGLDIQKALVGGIESFGMCCSEKELGISDNDDGLMALPADTKLGVDIKQLYEIDDIVFEVDNKSLTNRPDLWGHYGIAREIAALYSKPLKKVEINEDLVVKNDLNVSVLSENVYRYSALTVDGITKTVSPKNMQIRLHYTGYRPINLLTDLTNYVMNEFGQPMHAFDGDIVNSIVVKELSENHDFILLDNQKRTLQKDTLVISDNNNNILAVAGVMGGLDSGITNNTNKVFLESANFDATTVRKTSSQLGVRSESSSRFEKTLDPEMTTLAIKRYVHLLKQIDNGAKVSSNLLDIYNKKYPTVIIKTSKEYIDGYIGQDLGEDLILDILKRLEYKVVAVDGEYTISVPTHRATKDVLAECDIVEEITRIYGYDNLLPKPTLQSIVAVSENRFTNLEYNIKYLLATKFSLNEVHSNLWYDSESNKELGINPNSVIKLVNALQKENSDLRQTMIPSLLKFVNENKNSENEMGMFEIGRVADSLNKDGLVNEVAKLGIVRYSKTLSETELLKEVKSIAEYIVNYELNHELIVVKKTHTKDYYNPVNHYEFYVNDMLIGEIAQLHPTVKNAISKNCAVVVCELNVTLLSELPMISSTYKKTTKYPVTEFDFSFLTDNNTLFSELSFVANQIKDNTNLMYSYEFVTSFNEPDNKKSQTLKFKVWSQNKTLTSAELDEVYDVIVNTFSKNGFLLKQ